MPKRRRHAVRPAAGPRAGFTLAELMVTVVLLGIVCAALLTFLNRQQRFYRSANEIIDARTQLRQAAGILPLDVRGVSTVGRDLLVIEPTRLRMLGNFGSAVVCARPAGALFAHSVYLPPLNAAKNTYTTWFMPPQQGDSVFLFDENVGRGASDDRWVRFAIDSVIPEPASVCPPTATPSFTLASEDAKPRYRVRVRLPGRLRDNTEILAIPDSVKVGAAVRFERPVEYQLYQPAGSALWYLGFRESRQAGWTPLQPLGGPYRPAGGAAGDGVSFRYYTGAGVQVASTGDPVTVSRVDMVVRAAGTDRTNVISRKGPGGLFADSLALRVAIRNRF